MDTKRIWGVLILTGAVAIVISLLATPGTTPLDRIGIAYGSNSNTATSTVTVTSTAPSLTTVFVNFQGSNNTSSLFLVTNQTTSISVVTSITDLNGCSDLTNGTASVLFYRSGVSSSSCLSGTGSAVNNLNCYKLTGAFNNDFTATSSCQSATTINVTTTFGVYYFAQATDASSSFPNQNWQGTVIITSGSGRGTAGDSTNNTSTNIMATLNAISTIQTAINYGTVGAAQNTGATNQSTTIANAGNSSTTIQLYANPTLSLNGANVTFLATSSQQYATGTFTYGDATATALSGSPVTLTGFLLTAPTSTTNVSGTTFWGIGIASGTATGTYSGVNQFNSLFTN